MEVPVGLVAESIDGVGVRVRRYRDDDVADVQAGCDDPFTSRFLHQLPSPYTRDDAVWWVTEGSRPAFETGGGNFAIADPATDRLLGGIGITSHGGGNGEIGYWVAPWARGRGVARAATRALTDYAFSTGYGRLHLRTEFENVASQRVAIAAGYAREGVQRGAGVGRGGGRHDLVVWARLAGDPPGPSPRALPDLSGGSLTDGVVALRPLGPADLDETHAVWSLPEVYGDSPAGQAPTRAESARACAQAPARWLAGEAARVTIRDAVTGAHAGDLGLVYWAPQFKEATVGYALARAWRGRGYATRALVLFSRWVLGGAGIARLTAGTAPGNLASQRVLTKAGFTREGYLRGHIPAAGGRRSDVVSYALLATDLRRLG